jgi:hypothetical protein
MSPTGAVAIMSSRRNMSNLASADFGTGHPGVSRFIGQIGAQFRIGLIQYGSVILQAPLQRRALPAFVHDVF